MTGDQITQTNDKPSTTPSACEQLEKLYRSITENGHECFRPLEQKEYTHQQNTTSLADSRMKCDTIEVLV